MFLPAICAHGLVANGRRFVHLTSSLEYALSLKAKHDADNFPGVILGVQTERVVLEDLAFFQANSVVWTVDSVPPELLTILVFDEPTADAFRQMPILAHSFTDPSTDRLESLFRDSDGSR